MFGFAAVNTGNNLLFLIVAALLAFMAVSGILGWINIRGIEPVVELSDEIYSNFETLVTLRLTNLKRHFPSFLLKAHIFGTAADFNLLGARTQLSNTFVFTFTERGSRAVPLVQLSSPFPINFFVRSRWIAVNRSVIVFPAPLPCPLPPGNDRSRANGADAASAKGYEGDMTKISEYTGSEPLKLIHWRLSAKHGSLKVKELAATAHEPLLVEPAALPGRDLEEKLSCAAFLINRFSSMNRRVVLKLGDRILLPPDDSRNHRLRLLHELAIHGKT